MDQIFPAPPLKCKTMIRGTRSSAMPAASLSVKSPAETNTTPTNNSAKYPPSSNAWITFKHCCTTTQKAQGEDWDFLVLSIYFSLFLCFSIQFLNSVFISQDFYLRNSCLIKRNDSFFLRHTVVY